MLPIDSFPYARRIPIHPFHAVLCDTRWHRGPPPGRCDWCDEDQTRVASHCSTKTKTMAMERDPPRRAIHRWDVHVSTCKGREGGGDHRGQVDPVHEKVVLLQSPLRTKEQPHHMHGTHRTARIKASRAILEWENRNATRTGGTDRNEAGKNGPSQDSLDGHKEVVRGTQVATRAPYAVAVLHQGNIHITAINHCMQVRPVTETDGTQALSSEPNQADGQGNGNLHGQGEVDQDDLEKSNEAEAVQVRVRRRETDRQVDARMQSHAFLKKQEEEEAWTELRVLRGKDRPEKLWWTRPAHNAQTRGSNPNSNVVEASAGSFLDLLDPVMTVDKSRSHTILHRDKSMPLNGEVVRDTVCSILSDTPVLSEDILRAHLCRCEQAQAKEAASLNRIELDKLLEGVALRLGRVYVRDREGGEDARIRHIVAKCFRQSHVQGKAAMVDAVVAQMGYEPPPNVYNKVMKELCYIKGSNWVLKDGITG